MAEQVAAVEPSHPPEGMLRVVNPVMRLLLRSPVAGPMGKRLMLLRFAGRKTRRRYDIAISLSGPACGQLAGAAAEMKCLTAAMTSAVCSACGLWPA